MKTPYCLERDGYCISDDPARLDGDAIYAYISQSYWASTRQRNTQDIANRNSFCLGLYKGNAQVGFARVVTDYATFAYLCDVYLLPDHQGKGLGKWLIESLHAHPSLQGLRRWSLATLDAHRLYVQYGWTPLARTERWMEKFDNDANPPIRLRPGRGKSGSAVAVAKP